MRYVFVSDIHGEYDKLMTALDAVSFVAELDTIVSLGDPFDRGTKSLEVLQFLMSCPNRILVWGNHDLRLKELMICADCVRQYDYHNGVLETMRSFCRNDYIRTINTGMSVLNGTEEGQLLWNYFDECVYAVEWSDLIGTHAWIPHFMTTKTDSEVKFIYDENWRETSQIDWYDTTWANSMALFKQKIFEPNKILVIGHWHAKQFNGINHKTFYYNKNLVAIDGYSNAKDGLVNTFVYETDEEPIFIE